MGLNEKVKEIFFACLFKKGEDPGAVVKIEGVFGISEFHAGRLEKNKTAIEEMLRQLPSRFRDHKGVSPGGHFSEARDTADGKQWADSDESVDELFQLGLGIGKLVPLLPKKMWVALPDGKPYFYAI